MSVIKRSDIKPVCNGTGVYDVWYIVSDIIFLWHQLVPVKRDIIPIG